MSLWHCVQNWGPGSVSECPQSKSRLSNKACEQAGAGASNQAPRCMLLPF